MSACGLSAYFVVFFSCLRLVDFDWALFFVAVVEGRWLALSSHSQKVVGSILGFWRLSVFKISCVYDPKT